MSPAEHDEPKGLVEPDAHVGVEARDQASRDAVFGLGKRMRPRVLLVPRLPRRAPAVREVPVQINASSVLPGAGAEPVRVQVADHPEVDVAGGSAINARAIAVPAHSFPWMQPTTRIFVSLVGSPRRNAMIGRPSTECPSTILRTIGGAAARRGAVAARNPRDNGSTTIRIGPTSHRFRRSPLTLRFLIDPGPTFGCGPGPHAWHRASWPRRTPARATTESPRWPSGPRTRPLPEGWTGAEHPVAERRQHARIVTQRVLPGCFVAGPRSPAGGRWWARGELNPHPVPDTDLNRARLPIPPLARGERHGSSPTHPPRRERQVTT